MRLSNSSAKRCFKSMANYISELESLGGAVHHAADIALDYLGRVAADLKADQTLVTYADREIEQMLERAIRDRFPEDGILGEEQGLRPGRSKRLWIIDPIDGTVDYFHNLNSWAISVGLCESGRSVGGLVYAPCLRRFYLAGEGKSFCNGRSLQVQPMEFNSRNFVALNAAVPLSYSISTPTRICNAPSAVNPCLVADGSCVGSFGLECKVWDLAGSIPVLLGSGAKCEALSGGDFDFDAMVNGAKMREPILCGTSAFISAARGWFRKWDSTL